MSRSKVQRSWPDCKPLQKPHAPISAIHSPAELELVFVQPGKSTIEVEFKAAGLRPAEPAKRKHKRHDSPSQKHRQLDSVVNER